MPQKTIILSISIILSIFVIMYLGRSKTNFNNLALGEETTPYFAKRNDVVIHFTDLQSFKFNQIPESENVLILGNSQSHSINQMKPNEVNYIQILSDSLKNQADLLAVSLPNISLQEMMLSFDYIASKLKIDYLVLPVFMDDLREDGIRTDVFFTNLIGEKYFVSDTSLMISKKINAELKLSYSKGSTKSDMAALNETPQEIVETYLNSKLDDYSQVWKNRAQVRGDFYNFLYVSRNTLLGINAQTKRKMIPKRYEDNLDALKYILKKCEKLNIKSIVYVPPIRTDVEPPYDLNEYTTFKQRLENEIEICPNSRFLNLENIVPGEYWGTKAATGLNGKAELDFMHFQYKGHENLYESLIVELKKTMKK